MEQSSIHLCEHMQSPNLEITSIHFCTFRMLCYLVHSGHDSWVIKSGQQVLIMQDAIDGAFRWLQSFCTHTSLLK